MGTPEASLVVDGLVGDDLLHLIDTLVALLAAVCRLYTHIDDVTHTPTHLIDTLVVLLAAVCRLYTHTDDVTHTHW